jgi:broad specificity phosphatase PhoE
MKLILLRHEKRELYPGFYSKLTEEGLKDSNKLVKKLNKLSIDVIYSSPFVRTLQTIHPYCKKNNVKINIEYALHEYRHNPYFIFENKIYKIKDINNNNLTNIIDKTYKSLFKINQFNTSSLETEIILNNRLQLFLTYLKNNKELKNKNILIVTHKGIINKIKKIYKLIDNLDEDFDMGSFEIITI